MWGDSHWSALWKACSKWYAYINTYNFFSAFFELKQSHFMPLVWYKCLPLCRWHPALYIFQIRRLPSSFLPHPLPLRKLNTGLTWTFLNLTVIIQSYLVFPLIYQQYHPLYFFHLCNVNCLCPFFFSSPYTTTIPIGPQLSWSYCVQNPICPQNYQSPLTA